MISADSRNDKLIEKQNIQHLPILIGIALVIGVYLIVTTVVISKDGVFYIERAQQFMSDPVKIIKAHPPGYPFMILAAHKAISFFTHDNSNQAWIYSAQSVTLLCRLLALVPLYFMGKLLVGSKNSFWGVLILVLLPYSAQYCAEVLREWPYILFLAAGLFFLLWGAKSRKWWAFGLVGLISGLGSVIRYESAQLVIYGLFWVAISLCRPKLWGVVRWKIIIGLVLLLVGFAVSVVPYRKCVGRIIPSEVSSFMKVFSFNSLPDRPDEPILSSIGSNYNTAELVPGKALEALGVIFNTIGENLMWFFMLPLVIGFWCWLRGCTIFGEKFLMTSFVFFNLTIMVLQYCYRISHISGRWSLPLIVLTIYCVPIGLQTAGVWLSRFLRRQEQNERNSQFCFFVLLVIGAAICLPKLLRPVGIKKEGYRDAARWLEENTIVEDFVATYDKRIAFYAGRERVAYDDRRISKEAKYVIKIVTNKDERPGFNVAVREKYSTWLNDRDKSKRIIIYEVL